MPTARVKIGSDWQRKPIYTRNYIDKSLSADFESGTIGDYFDSTDVTFSLSTTQSYAGSYSLKGYNNTANPADTHHYAKKSISMIKNKANAKKIVFYFYYNGESNNDDMYFAFYSDSELRRLINLRRGYDQPIGPKKVFLGANNYNTGITLPSNKWIRVTFDNIDSINNYDIEIYNMTDTALLYSASTPYALDFKNITDYAFDIQPINKPFTCYYDDLTIEYEELEWQRRARYF